MARVAQLDMDINSLERSERCERIDCYALAETDLSGYALLAVSSMVDQEHLARHREVIERYLDGGGVLLFGGQLHRDWLPGASRFVPLEEPSLPAYQVSWIAEHPIFAGIGADALTFRRGVAGFFARGHHPLPPGAEVLVRLAGGEPVTYLDRVSTRGTIILHANGDLLADGMADSTLARLPAQVVAWALDEASTRQGAARSASRTTAPGSSSGLTATTGPLDVDPASLRARSRGLAAVYGGSAPHHRALTTAKYARHLSGGLHYLPDLADTDLAGLDGLIIAERLHRGLLRRAAPRLLELLDAGGTVVAFAGGEPIPEFLPGVSWEHRPTNFWWWLEPGADLALRTPSPEHPLFDHLSLSDCTWHYHGVLEPPPDAQALVTLPTGEVLLYIDRSSTPGALIVSTLDPISHYGSYFMPATERFLDGFLPWLADAVGGRALSGQR